MIKVSLRKTIPKTDRPIKRHSLEEKEDVSSNGIKKWCVRSAAGISRDRGSDHIINMLD